MPAFKLVALSKRYKGHEYPLSNNTTVIGRNDDCDIPMQTQLMSRRHAEFAVTDAGIVLKDLGSHNGSYVNGEKIEEQLLKDQDQIQVGGVRFKVRAVEESIAEEDDEFTPPIDTPLPVPNLVDVSERDFLAEEDASLTAFQEKDEPHAGEILEAGESNTNSTIFIGILFIAIVIGIIVLVTSMKDPEIKPKVILLKAGEEKCLNTNTFITNGEEPSSLEVSDPTILRAEFFTPPNRATYRWLVDLKPLRWGKAIVTFKKGSKILQKLKVIVKGQVHKASDQYTSTLMTNNEKHAQAMEFFAKAKSIEESDPYESMMSYRLSYDIALSMSPKPEEFLQIKSRLERMMEEVDRNLVLLWEQFYNRTKNGEPIEAMKELKSIINFIHDTSNMDYQRALIYLKKIEKSLTRKR